MIKLIKFEIGKYYGLNGKFYKVVKRDDNKKLLSLLEFKTENLSKVYYQFKIDDQLENGIEYFIDANGNKINSLNSTNLINRNKYSNLDTRYSFIYDYLHELLLEFDYFDEDINKITEDNLNELENELKTELIEIKEKIKKFKLIKKYIKTFNIKI